MFDFDEQATKTPTLRRETPARANHLLFFISILQKIFFICLHYTIKNKMSTIFRIFCLILTFSQLYPLRTLGIGTFFGKRKRLTAFFSRILFNVFLKIFLSFFVRCFLFFKPFFTTLFIFFLSNYFFLWFHIFEVV